MKRKWGIHNIKLLCQTSACIIWVNFHIHPARWVFLSPFYQHGNWSSKSLKQRPANNGSQPNLLHTWFCKKVVLELSAIPFTVTRTWKQFRCPSTDKWIKKYTIKYYSPIKRNESESLELRWIKLEPVTQNEESQIEKSRYCILMHIHGI